MALSRALGPILRVAGLALELAGLTILALSGRKGGLDVGARLGIGANAVWTVVAVGFSLWVSGTALIYLNRAGPKRQGRDGF
jgi:hypothetical protein